MYFQSEGLITAEDVVYLRQQWRSVQDNRPRVLGINWTYTPNSRWANVVRVGYVLMNRESDQIDSNLPATTYGINTGVTTVGSLPIIRVKGFNQLGGSPGWPYRFGPDSVHQLVDYVSYLRGNHAIKFGGDFRHNYADPSQRGSAKGSINFLPQDSTHPGLEYASSDFDITHRFTFSVTYAIPGKKAPAQLLQGWELNSIVTVQTGQPWYGNDQGDNISGTSEFADRWDFVGNPHDFKSGNSSIPYCAGDFTSQTTIANTVSCTQLTPAGTVRLSSAQTKAAATTCANAAAATFSSLQI